MEIKWKCEANEIANYEYNGESTAYIHLGSYSCGNDYSVTLNADKTIAKGTTGDNTPFICKK